MNSEIKRDTFKSEYSSYEKIKNYDKNSYDHDYSSYETKTIYNHEFKGFFPDDEPYVPEVNPHRVANILFVIGVAVFLLGSLTLFLIFGLDGLQVPLILLGFIIAGGLVQAISEGQGG